MVLDGGDIKRRRSEEAWFREAALGDHGRTVQGDRKKACVAAGVEGGRRRGGGQELGRFEFGKVPGEEGAEPRLGRREFLEKLGLGLVGLGGLYAAMALPGCGGGSQGTCPTEGGTEAEAGDIPPPAGGEGIYRGLVVAGGKDPRAALREGLREWGGLESMNPLGKKVLIKVNAAFARSPEDAVTTHPDLVSEAVRLFLTAGASEVVVYDHILQDLVEPTLEKNGIGPAAREAGARLAVYAVKKPGPSRVIQVPGGKALSSIGILEEIFQADLIVNMPKAKHHSGAGLTLAMKNLIGCTQNMGRMHDVDLHRAIAELNTVIRPSLVILDATSVLLDHGPGGPGTVARPEKIIIGTDPVAVDAYACGLFGRSPDDIRYLSYGEELGVGIKDYRSLGVKEVKA
jgi:uncharacterized protein (DUF362 family)